MNGTVSGRGSAGASTLGSASFWGFVSPLKGKTTALVGMHGEDCFSVSEILCEKTPTHAKKLGLLASLPLLAAGRAAGGFPGRGAEPAEGQGRAKGLKPGVVHKESVRQCPSLCRAAPSIPGTAASWCWEGCSGGRCPRLTPWLQSETRRRASVRVSVSISNQWVPGRRSAFPGARTEPGAPSASCVRVCVRVCARKNQRH